MTEQPFVLYHTIQHATVLYELFMVLLPAPFHFRGFPLGTTGRASAVIPRAAAFSITLLAAVALGGFAAV